MFCVCSCYIFLSFFLYLRFYPGSGFVGGFSGLGGKPQEPNRNPFEARPSSQISGEHFFFFICLLSSCDISVM